MEDPAVNRLWVSGNLLESALVHRKSAKRCTANPQGPRGEVVPFPRLVDAFSPSTGLQDLLVLWYMDYS